MDILRHRRCLAAFKCILPVIWLALFTSQLSYKFYEFASFPFGQRTAVAHSHNSRPLILAVNSESKAPQKVFLLLDKRYELKHISNFFSPGFHVIQLSAVTAGAYPIVSWNILSRRIPTHFLRGPPYLI